MRPAFYKRTTPEARWGLVFIVALVVAIMARDHMGRRQARQRLLRPVRG